MVRIIVAAVGLALLAFLCIRLIREVRSLDLDWTGIVICCAFVTLAFFLRFTTGIG